ncbi:MAG TPA: carbon-nitrogen hydrolase family protein [Humisphaera sp.]
MTSDRSVLVAAVQMSSAFGDVAGNAGRLERLVHRASDAGAKIIVSPECAVPGYASADLRCIWRAESRTIDPWFRPRDVTEVAEPVPGPTTERFGRLARERGIWLLIGMIERAGAAAHNAAVLLSPAGEVAAVHRKRWPWPAVEPAWATPGDLPPVRCPTPFGTLGVAVCYDIHRVRRLYAPGDLWALLFPAAWVDVDPPEKYFDRRFPKVATTLGCHVVFANHCSPRADVRFYGSGESAVYRADGSVAARSSEQFAEDVVLAELPTAAGPL